MFNTKIIALCCMASAALCSAAEVVEVYDLSKVENWGKRDPIGIYAPGVIRAKGRITLSSRKIYPYDSTKTYTFKGLYRQLPGSDSNIFRIGILTLDKDKKVIEFVHSHPIPKTDAVLAKAVTAKDTVIYVKGGADWRAYSRIAYNTKPDQSDIPNRNIINSALKKVEKTSDGWKVTLAKPAGVAIAKGTNVRQHYLGGRFRFAGVGTGSKVLSNLKCVRWDKGTKFFQVIVVSGADGLKPGDKAPVLEMRNPRIEVTK